MSSTQELSNIQNQLVRCAVLRLDEEAQVWQRKYYAWCLRNSVGVEEEEKKEAGQNEFVRQEMQDHSVQ